MDRSDYDAFAKMLDAVYSLHNKTLTAEAKAIFFRSMARYPLDVVRSAIDANVRDPQRGQYPPKPADLMAQIEGRAANDGRPGAEEAWAIALRGADESETVVTTPEIVEAFGICQSVLETGDEVGARMAFKEAYSRLVSHARAAGRPVNWSASLGWDIAKREGALRQAEAAGLLPASTVAALLPPPAKVSAGEKSAEGLARLKEAVAKLEPASVKLQRAREERSAAERAQVAARKLELAASVTAYAKERA